MGVVSFTTRPLYPQGPTYENITSVEHSSFWEAISRSAYQEIPYPTFYNAMILYRLHKTPPLARILNQTNPLQVLMIYLFKIHFKPILPSMPRLPKCDLLFMLSEQNFTYENVQLRNPDRPWYDKQRGSP